MFLKAGQPAKNAPYVPVVSFTKEEQEKYNLAPFFNLAPFADPRAAAYIVDKFLENRDENVANIKNFKNGTWGSDIEIPAFKYEAVNSNVNHTVLNKPAEKNFKIVLEMLDINKAMRHLRSRRVS